MLKPYTIGMVEHNAKNDPTVIAAAELENGVVFTIDANHKAALPTAATAKQNDLYVAINNFAGDEYATGAKIKAGAYVNAYLLAAWDQMYLEIGQTNLADDIADEDIEVGDTLVANTDGQFEVEDTLTGYAIYLKVAELINLGGELGVRAQVVVVDQDTKPAPVVGS